MFFLLKQIFKLVKLLNSETGTNQIAFGLALGIILGFAPGFSLQTLVLFLIILFFRVQMGAAFLSALLFKIFSYPLDPAFTIVGKYVLELDFMYATYTYLYNLPLFPLTRFNNSVYMGSMVVSIILAPVVFVLARILVVKYRQQVLERIQKSKLFKMLKASTFYQWYEKYENYKA